MSKAKRRKKVAFIKYDLFPYYSVQEVIKTHSNGQVTTTVGRWEKKNIIAVMSDVKADVFMIEGNQLRQNKRAMCEMFAKSAEELIVRMSDRRKQAAS